MSRDFFKACGKPDCRICAEWLATDPPRESAARLACATLAMVLFVVFFLFLLPVLA
jgi:hypothetical protein